MIIKILSNALGRTDLLTLVSKALIGTWGNDGNLFHIGKIAVSFVYNSAEIENPSKEYAGLIVGKTASGGVVESVAAGGVYTSSEPFIVGIVIAQLE